ncbi:DUF1631 domain-containing protein [Sessilibacter corallicola]|uniref:DUF1631 domain-containing protein n=1 Tax=Sessilibacter corallicola TaxID=2904075 RepID=UPI001E5CE8CA|nr:DUF1631 domain-containing protein [Sessilibacter corallicola]MCE2028713.1 DUF1631 domain-containing protein [Sessilibacter corallicola]
MSHKSQGNVVELRPPASTPSRRPNKMVRLPAAVHLVKEKATYFLQSSLLALFDNVDDTLFELADKSNNNQDQNLYFESMRQVRLKRREMETEFIQRIHDSFDRLAQSQEEGAEEQEWNENLDLDNLALINNDQLEQNVAVESMVNKAVEQSSTALQNLTLRVNSLVPVKVSQRNNPIGPSEICNSFLKVSESLEANIKVKLVLLKLFDRHLVSGLRGFYGQMNDILIQRDVLPELNDGSARAAKPNSPRGYRKPAPQGDQNGAENGAQEGSFVPQDVLQTFRNLIGNAEADLSQQAPVEEDSVVIDEGALVHLLSQIQKKQSASENNTANLDVNNLQKIVSATNQGAIGQLDRDVINLINMLFEFIVNDRNLAAEMKALLSRLQIPMLKIAISDKEFFDRGGHPAKRLLNEMATAALGWVPNAKGRDNLLGKVEETVDKICDDPNVGADVFEQMLTDFLSFVEKEKKQAAILEKRTLDAEAGKAKAETARHIVEESIAKLNNVDQLSEPMQTLVHEAWANFMFLIALKEGTDSPKWVSAQSTVRNLVWSLTSKITSSNRVKLVKLLPELLKRLRAGLESISYNAYDMGKLFKQLEAEHLAQLKGQPRPEPKVNMPGAAKPVRSSESALAKLAKARQDRRTAEKAEDGDVPATPVAERNPLNQRPISPEAHAQSLVNRNIGNPISTSPQEEPVEEAESNDPEPQFLDQVDSLSQGSWFEIKEGPVPIRCRLAAIIRPTGKYIFVNRSGMKVAEKDRNELAICLRSGEVRMLDNSMLFDRALESVISNLRQSKGLS